MKSWRTTCCVSIALCLLAAASVSANVPPTVQLISPRTGEIFVAPATITLQATASDPDGTIANVKFFNGMTLLGEDRIAPYTFTWRNVAADTYTLRALATDKGGATGSAEVTITVQPNNPPTVQWMQPAAGASFTASAMIGLEVTAQDPDGVGIASVEFFQGQESLLKDFSAPYTFTWRNVAAGTYTLKAVATDKGGATSEASRTLTVQPNTPPILQWVTPTAGATFIAPATIELKADASDPDGVGITIVEFFQLDADPTKPPKRLGGDTTSPYTSTWRNVAAGTYTLKAVATDKGGATSEASRTLTVQPNTPPILQWVTPTAGATFPAPATLTLEVTAQDPDGVGIAFVEFFQGQESLRKDFSAPYTFTWRNVPAGTYTLRALATDKGTATQEATLTITVGQAPPANQPPTVTLTQPLTGQQFTAPATIGFEARVTDAQGQAIPNATVTYFHGGSPIGTATSAPYAFKWTNVPKGTYDLFVEATTPQRATGTTRGKPEKAVAVTVNPPTTDTTPPTIQAVLPPPGPSLYAEETVTVSATVLDRDPSPLEYQFSIDGAVQQRWSAATTYHWTTTAAMVGVHTITVEVRDAGGSDANTTTRYLYLKPPGPP